MYTVCDGNDYRVEERENFLSTKVCTKTYEIYLEGDDEVKATKTEYVRCPCKEEVSLKHEDTKGWEVAMWIAEQAEPHFECLRAAGAIGEPTAGTYNLHHR